MDSPFRSQPDDPGTFRHEALGCPWCNARLDATTNFTSGRTPWDGARIVCVYCTNMAVFQVSALLGDLGLRKPTRQEAADFAVTHATALRTLREHVKQNPPPSVKRATDKGGYQ